MTEPIYDDTTERAYLRLPSVYRFEDARNNWTMKKYMQSIFGVLDEVNTLLDRFTYVPPDDLTEETDLSSDLVNPVNADAEWLPWLAQLVGVNNDYVTDEALKRTRIENAFDGARPGTKEALIQAVQTILTGTKEVYVHPFSNNVGGIGSGTQWEVLIITRAEETNGDVVATVTNLGAKPAGVKIYWDTYGSNWTLVEGTLPTWADWDSKTWQQIESLE
jgi:hypothetical protein